jgi:hypothetical protein
LSAGGKGSAPRPLSIPPQQFSDNWDRIFKPAANDRCPTHEVETRDLRIIQGTCTAEVIRDQD